MSRQLLASRSQSSRGRLATVITSIVTPVSSCLFRSGPSPSSAICGARVPTSAAPPGISTLSAETSNSAHSSYLGRADRDPAARRLGVQQLFVMQYQQAFGRATCPAGGLQYSPEVLPEFLAFVAYRTGLSSRQDQLPDHRVRPHPRSNQQ